MLSPTIIASVVCISFVAPLISCSTTNGLSKPQPLSGSHIETPPGIAGLTPRQLPPLDVPQEFWRRYWYPIEAEKKGLTGKVLTEFTIDANGAVQSEKVIGADAAPSLQRASLEMLRQMKFKISDRTSDSTDPTPFRGTFLWCLGHCPDLNPYPGSVRMAVTTASAFPSQVR